MYYQFVGITGINDNVNFEIEYTISKLPSFIIDNPDNLDNILNYKV